MSAEIMGLTTLFKGIQVNEHLHMYEVFWHFDKA
jgi:hypothetical protein